MKVDIHKSHFFYGFYHCFLKKTGVYRLFGFPIGIAKHLTNLDSISYCLTNEEHFIQMTGIFCLYKKRSPIWGLQSG